jgi:cysteine sulfinate desulfinase/cysteine desulfurase-like protein
LNVHRVYLDFNATTPLDVQVIEAINESLINNWQNPSSQYKKGKQAKEKIDEARQSISTMINSLSPSDIIFLSGGTEVNSN